jgi:hypothetical protein
MGYQRMVFDSRLSRWPENEDQFLLNLKSQRAFRSATVAASVPPAYIVERVSIKQRVVVGAAAMKHQTHNLVAQHA